jgi:hypothetical protein
MRVMCALVTDHEIPGATSVEKDIRRKRDGTRSGTISSTDSLLNPEMLSM